MTIRWTTDQVLALVKDPARASDGQKLAVAARWSALGRTDEAAWGECKGSSKAPYRTQIDLNGPAFRCSCPSRQFPCKHAVGLFLLLAGQPDAFAIGQPPAWAAAWLGGRARRVQDQAERQPATRPGDDGAQARRAAKREAKVRAGMQEIERWLRDLMQSGLAAVASQPESFWEAPAARMVDAQAPGVARRLRAMAALPASGEGWPERLLEQVGRLHLLISGFHHLEALPPDMQIEIRTQIGWTQKQDELRQRPGLYDRWLVAGKVVEKLAGEANLLEQRTWLLGYESGRAALLLDFAPGHLPFTTDLTPGTCTAVELVFYDGTYPLRALPKGEFSALTRPEHFPGAFPTFDAALGACAAALTRNPWLGRFPMPTEQVRPLWVGDGWALRDAAGTTLPLAPPYAGGWELLAVSGGHPVAVFAEWDGRHLWPLSAWADGRLVVV